MILRLTILALVFTSSVQAADGASPYIGRRNLPIYSQTNYSYSHDVPGFDPLFPKKIKMVPLSAKYFAFDDGDVTNAPTEIYMAVKRLGSNNQWEVLDLGIMRTSPEVAEMIGPCQRMRKGATEPMKPDTFIVTETNSTKDGPVIDFFVLEISDPEFETKFFSSVCEPTTGRAKVRTILPEALPLHSFRITPLSSP